MVVCRFCSCAVWVGPAFVCLGLLHHCTVERGFVPVDYARA